jgi:hypothetical protein
MERVGKLRRLCGFAERLPERVDTLPGGPPSAVMLVLEYRRRMGSLCVYYNAKWRPSADAICTLTRLQNYSCPSWDRTRTLLIQSQACCQLHQGALLPLPQTRPQSGGIL